eukprot:CAMPEP_0170183980 /NCGR_PEP_ID=MMETSP0040_2-20121228/32394_1 /TAXON_ID=641309 /ORGANISM="Lotharella oceanica, Strain CCMP622" /LENGTH=133 /DNA_ID=CAMNT_0010429889 /DNA_START=72 /DNA_END=473 /DNA_ORIENTATION=+
MSFCSWPMFPALRHSRFVPRHTQRAVRKPKPNTCPHRSEALHPVLASTQAARRIPLDALNASLAEFLSLLNANPANDACSFILRPTVRHTSLNFFSASSPATVRTPDCVAFPTAWSAMVAVVVAYGIADCASE